MSIEFLNEISVLNEREDQIDFVIVKFDQEKMIRINYLKNRQCVDNIIQDQF